MSTNARHYSKLRSLCCRTTILLGVLHAVLALSRVIGGIILINRAVPFRVDIFYSIVAIIFLPAGGLMLASAFIWISSCIYPHNRPLNGVNLGFSIVSFLASCVCFAMDAIGVSIIAPCTYTRKDSCVNYVEQAKFCYPMFAFSLMLVILSIGNTVRSSREACCPRPTHVLEEVVAVQGMKS